MIVTPLVAPLIAAAGAGLKDKITHPPWTLFEEASKKQLEASKVMTTTTGLTPRDVYRYEDLHTEYVAMNLVRIYQLILYRLEGMRIALEKRRTSWKPQVIYWSQFSKYVEKIGTLVELANVGEGLMRILHMLTRQIRLLLRRRM
jgi:hypothetical protein